MDIKVSVDSGMSLDLRVVPDDCVESIKHMIQVRIGLLIEKQRLFFEDKELDDNDIIKDCKIRNKSIIKLVVTRIDPIKIQVETEFGVSFPLMMNPDSYITHLSGIMNDKTGVFFDRMQFIFQGKKLASGRLGEYKIGPDSTLKMIIIKKSDLKEGKSKPKSEEVTIQCDCGWSVPIKIDSDDTVASLKSMIEKEVGIPESCQFLSFEGKNLDSGTLRDSGVKHGSTIQLNHTHQKKIEIALTTDLGVSCSLFVKPDDTVSSTLMSSIEEIMGLPESFQSLDFESKQLDRKKNLSDYGIVDKSTVTLHVIPASIPLHVKAPVSKAVTVYVHPDDSVIDLKYLIQGLIGIPVHAQTLYVNRRELCFGTMNELKIKPNSTIKVQFGI